MGNLKRISTYSNLQDLPLKDFLLAEYSNAPLISSGKLILNHYNATQK